MNSSARNHLRRVRFRPMPLFLAALCCLCCLADRGALADGGKSPLPVEKPAERKVGKIGAGDIIQVHYSAFLQDGSLVFTTNAEVAGDPRRMKAAGFFQAKSFSPEEWIAGREAKFSGAEKMVLGMAVGEKVRMPLPPGAAFGAVDAGKVKSFPLVKKMEKNVRLGARDFVNRFGRFPAKGDEVPLTPYFRGRIVEISENDVRLVTEPEDGAEFQEEFGTARIRVQAEYIALTLNPRIGAIFKTPEGDGRIVSATASEFTVDFNHPLAGKAIELEIEAVSLTPQSALESFKIPWREDHDEALASMVTGKKPAVLVLYADWCSWSKKLFKDSLEDPRLRRLHDRLIWIRVNSDQKAEYAKKYQQNGFPLILFFQTDGTIAARIDGFSNPARLLEAVIPLLEPSAPKES